MQHVQELGTGKIGHTYAEPLWGLRVSWGSVLAGAVATIAVALILWSLAFAIVTLGANATEASMRVSAAALWICAMAATLIGALVGGYLAGYLPGNARPAIAAHGFLAWCVAFLMSFLFGLAILRSTATVAMMQAAARGEPTGMTESMSAPADPDAASDAAMSRMPKASLVGMSWSWFGTWIVALGFSVGGAALGAGRSRTVESEIR